NIEIISNHTKGYEFLFSDKDKLALSSTETLPGIIEQRISSYKLQKELEQAREAERTAREQAEQAKAEPEQEIDEVPEPGLETVNDAPIEANGDVSERPTDEEIIGALADYFFAVRETDIEWIKEMELLNERFYFYWKPWARCRGKAHIKRNHSVQFQRCC